MERHSWFMISFICFSMRTFFSWVGTHFPCVSNKKGFNVHIKKVRWLLIMGRVGFCRFYTLQIWHNINLFENRLNVSSCVVSKVLLLWNPVCVYIKLFLLLPRKLCIKIYSRYDIDPLDSIVIFWWRWHYHVVLLLSFRHYHRLTHTTMVIP